MCISLDGGCFVAKTPGSGGVTSVERAVDVLELMANAQREVGLTELAALSGLPMPTVHRLVRTLVGRGYLRQLPSRRYALGAPLIRLGERARRSMAPWARPQLAALVESIGETANMAILDGDMVVYVAQVPSQHSMRMFTEVGRRVPAHCSGVGKAVLSQLAEAEVRELVTRAGMPARTPHTITDPDVLAAELRLVRARGWAEDDGEAELGVRCFAVAVPRTPVVTAISVSGPQGRVTPEAAARIVPLLQRAAEELSDDPGEDASTA
jgi:IclR family acetate operon transcriptional repressor